MCGGKVKHSSTICKNDNLPCSIKSLVKRVQNFAKLNPQKLTKTFEILLKWHNLAEYVKLNKKPPVFGQCWQSGHLRLQWSAVQIHLSCLVIYTLFFNTAKPSLFFIHCRYLKSNNTIVTTSQCKKVLCLSNMWHEDSNSQPLEHELSPITTRPGLPPIIYTRLTGEKTKKQIKRCHERPN